MGNIKKLNPLSEWLEFELETPPAWLDSPTVRFRVRPITGLSGFNVTAEDRAPSAAFAAMVIDAIEEWGFTNTVADPQSGKMEQKPLPCTTETKQGYAGNLRVLLGSELKGKKGLLGIELAAFAADPENFLKN